VARNHYSYEKRQQELRKKKKREDKEKKKREKEGGPSDDAALYLAMLRGEPIEEVAEDDESETIDDES